MRGARAYFVGCAALIGFTLAYALPIYARLPHPFYDPIARHWFWAATGGGPIPMGYVGQIVWGAAGALAGGALAALATATVRAPSPRAWGLWAAWTLTVLGIVAGYFAWNNWP